MQAAEETRLKYLAAMRIDVWVRRSLRPAAQPMTGDSPPGDEQQPRDLADVRELSPATSDPVEESSAARELDVGLGTTGTADPASVIGSLIESVSTSRPVSRSEPAAQVPAEPAAERSTLPEPDTAPSFALVLLSLGQTGLVVDASALHHAAPGARGRLQDLLRTAALCLGDDWKGKVASNEFRWPPEAAAGMDTSADVAGTALTAFLHKRLGLRRVVHVESGGDLLDPLLDETLGRVLADLVCLRVEAEFLAAPRAAADVQLYERMCREFESG